MFTLLIAKQCTNQDEFHRTIRESLFEQTDDSASVCVLDNATTAWCDCRESRACIWMSVWMEKTRFTELIYHPVRTVLKR